MRIAHSRRIQQVQMTGRQLGKRAQVRGGGLAPRRIGRALRRVEGLDVRGLAVRRVDVDRDGIQWAVNEITRL